MLMLQHGSMDSGRLDSEQMSLILTNNTNVNRNQTLCVIECDMNDARNTYHFKSHANSFSFSLVHFVFYVNNKTKMPNNFFFRFWCKNICIQLFVWPVNSHIPYKQYGGMGKVGTLHTWIEFNKLKMWRTSDKRSKLFFFFSVHKSQYANTHTKTIIEIWKQIC